MWRLLDPWSNAHYKSQKRKCLITRLRESRVRGDREGDGDALRAHVEKLSTLSEHFLSPYSFYGALKNMTGTRADSGDRKCSSGHRQRQWARACCPPIARRLGHLAAAQRAIKLPDAAAYSVIFITFRKCHAIFTHIFRTRQNMYAAVIQLGEDEVSLANCHLALATHMPQYVIGA